MELKNFEKAMREKQLETWSQVRHNLSQEEKEELIKEILEEGIWGYIDLISEVIFDIAEDSEGYVKLLENISSKTKNDLAQGPFRSALVRIGQEKPAIAESLRKKIIQISKEDKLIVMSGFILGGIGKRAAKTVVDKVSSQINTEGNTLILQSYVNALLVLNEDKKIISKKQEGIIIGLVNKHITIVDLELLNFSLVNYKKDRTFLYGIIKNLITEDDDTLKQFTFYRLSYTDLIEENKVFELIDLSKDSNEKVIDNILLCLRKFPKNNGKNLELIFYWINKGLYFKLRNLDWVLGEIIKNDNSVVTALCNSFRQIDKRFYLVIVPDIFEIIVKEEPLLAVREAFQLRPNDRAEELMKLKLFRVIIGHCYADKDNAKYIQMLAKHLLNETKKRPYIKERLTPRSKLLCLSTLTEDEYNQLVDITTEIIGDLETRKESFDAQLINTNLEKYPYLREYAQRVILESQEKKYYTPLLMLLENETPDLTNTDLSETKNLTPNEIMIYHRRNEFWSRAYLYELNYGLQLFNELPDPKYNTSEKKKRYVEDNLRNEERFWSFLSEILILNRLGLENVQRKDVIIGEQDIDFETQLFGKKVFFEVTAPEMDRKLRLANGAVGIKNKLFSVIDKKYKQIMKTGIYRDSRYADDFYYYLIIDLSNSIIDEYDLSEALFGREIHDATPGAAIKSYQDRTKSYGYKNKKSGIISGIIYFKKQLVIDAECNAHIKLMGDVIDNPDSIRILNNEEVQKVKEILF